MSDALIRTRMLLGDEPLSRIMSAKVAVFGVGGVGGFCVEALARAGVGTLHLYDDDTVSESNPSTPPSASPRRRWWPAGFWISTPPAT